MQSEEVDATALADPDAQSLREALYIIAANLAPSPKRYDGFGTFVSLDPFISGLGLHPLLRMVRNQVNEKSRITL